MDYNLLQLIVGLKLEKYYLQIVLFVLAGASLWGVMSYVGYFDILFPLVYLMYAIFMSPIFRIPFKQAVTAMLFSFTFDLLFIRVFQFNILEMLLESSGIEQDSFIITIMYLFIGLNCLIVAGYAYHYHFTYVSDLFFQKNR